MPIPLGPERRGEMHIDGFYTPRFEAVESHVFRPEGIGYGVGPVGVQNRLNDPDDLLTPEMMDRARGELESPDLLLPLGRDKDGRVIDDDGCSDGREMKMIITFGEPTRQAPRPTFDRLRPKLFGGGLVMDAAGIIANRMAKGHLNAVFEQAHDRLRVARVSYGGHGNCGATIYAPIILHNTLAFMEEISNDVLGMAETRGAKNELGGALDLVFNNNKKYLATYGETFRQYNHSAVTESIHARRKIVTQPGTEHHEVGIGVNVDVEDRSIDQARIRHDTNDAAQLFTMDIPRLVRLSDRGYDDVDRKKIAFVGGLVYSFATLATLTRGDLPTIFRYVESPYIDLSKLFGSDIIDKDEQDTVEFAQLHLDSES